MPLLGACAVPHPPLIIPEIGRGQEQGISATIEAYKKAAEFDTIWEAPTHEVAIAQINAIRAFSNTCQAYDPEEIRRKNRKNAAKKQ